MKTSAEKQSRPRTSNFDDRDEVHNEPNDPNDELLIKESANSNDSNKRLRLDVTARHELLKSIPFHVSR